VILTPSLKTWSQWRILWWHAAVAPGRLRVLQVASIQTRYGSSLFNFCSSKFSIVSIHEVSTTSKVIQSYNVLRDSSIDNRLALC